MQEQQCLVANLGDLDGLILENHGTLVVDRTVAEACTPRRTLERVAQTQLRAMAAMSGWVPPVSDTVAQQTCARWSHDGKRRDGDAVCPRC